MLVEFAPAQWALVHVRFPLYGAPLPTPVDREGRLDTEHLLGAQVSASARMAHCATALPHKTEPHAARHRRNLPRCFSAILAAG